MTTVMSAPVRFAPSMERVEDDKNDTRDALIETMRSISETTFKNSGHALRSVHAKSHALLKGELEVLEGLPEPIAQGMFARSGRLPVGCVSRRTQAICWTIASPLRAALLSR